MFNSVSITVDIIELASKAESLLLIISLTNKLLLLKSIEYTIYQKYFIVKLSKKIDKKEKYQLGLINY